MMGGNNSLIHSLHTFHKWKTKQGAYKMDEALQCRCGSLEFCLLKNGMIECKKCTKHLNGGHARWCESRKVEVEAEDGTILTFNRKPDLYETLHIDAPDGKRHRLELVHTVDQIES